jgi:hypothetical protein
MKLVVGEKVVNPGVFRTGLVEEFAGFEAYYLEA